jgi:hypothetical protein
MTSSASVNMHDPVPAVAEAGASGEIGSIFTDIRNVLVEVINLIWRHLATIPGALPWAWGTLRPAYVDGTIAAEAAALHGEIELPSVPAFPADVLAAAGLSSGDLKAIRDVLAAYDRTNAMALVALSALLLRLAAQPPELDAVALHGVNLQAEPAPRIPLPALLNVAELKPTIAELVMRLNRLGTRSDSPILASMYRHLAHWPAYLALIWTILAPLDADGSLSRSNADVLAKTRVRGARLATRLRPPFDVPIARATKIQAAVEPFAGDVIAKMVVICSALRIASRGS